MTAHAVEVKDLVQQFGAFRALDHVSLQVPEGSFTVLLGPSGSGKTTLLSIIGGFQTPQSGAVLIDGAEMTHVPPARRPTTTMFQDYALFPHMTIAANVGFGLRMRKVETGKRKARVAEMLDLVGLGTAADKKPHQLSGGQRQRVALARALAVEPKVLLLDEPLGALDLKLRRQMQVELKRIQREVGTTFIHVTHDQEEAMAIADEIVVMSAGRTEDRGPPGRVYLRPQTKFAATFMGQGSFIDGTVRDVTGDLATVDTGFGALQAGLAEPGIAVGDAVSLFIRPEHFHLADALPGTTPLTAPFTIDSMTFYGTSYHAEMSANGLVAAVLLPQVTTAKTGDAVRLAVSPGAATAMKR